MLRILLIHHVFSEMLKQKDELIQQTVAEKRKLIGEILNIPPEDFEHIAEVRIRTLILNSWDQE